MGLKTHGPLLIDAIEKNDLKTVSHTIAKHFRNRSNVKNFLWSRVPRLLFESETEVPMLLASGLQDAAILNYFVTTHGADVNRLFSSGCPKKNKIKTCLITAVKAGAYEVVGYLLSMGSDVNRADHKLRTPLHHAVRRSDYSMAKLLISKGAVTNNTDIAGNTPLHISTLHGHLQLVRLLMKSGADLYKRGHFGASALHMAAREGHAHLVDAFCQQMGLHPDLKVMCYGDVEQASIHLASERGHLEVLRYLIEESNGDIDLLDSSGQSALHRCFLQLANPFNLDSSEIKERQAETCHFLLQLGADPDIRDNTRNTALHLATKNGYERGVQILLTAGANCGEETRNSAGDRPLDVTSDKSGLTANMLKHANQFNLSSRSQLASEKSFYRSSSARLNSCGNLSSVAGGSVNRLNNNNLAPRYHSHRYPKQKTFSRTLSSPGLCEDDDIDDEECENNEYVLSNASQTNINRNGPILFDGSNVNVSNLIIPDVIPYVDQSPERQNKTQNFNSVQSNNGGIYIHPLNNVIMNGTSKHGTKPKALKNCMQSITSTYQENRLDSNSTSNLTSLAYDVIDDDRSVTTTIKNFKTDSIDGVADNSVNIGTREKNEPVHHKFKKSKGKQLTNSNSVVSSSLWTVTPESSVILHSKNITNCNNGLKHKVDNKSKHITNNFNHVNASPSHTNDYDDSYFDDNSFDTVSSSSVSIPSSNSQSSTTPSLSSFSSSSSSTPKKKFQETNFDDSDDLSNKNNKKHSIKTLFTTNDKKTQNLIGRRTPPPVPIDQSGNSCKRLFVILLDKRQFETHDVIQCKPGHPPEKANNFVVKKEISKQFEKLINDDNFLTNLSKNKFDIPKCLGRYIPLKNNDFDTHPYENVTSSPEYSTKYIVKQVRNSVENIRNSGGQNGSDRGEKYVWCREKIKFKNKREINGQNGRVDNLENTSFNNYNNNKINNKTNNNIKNSNNNNSSPVNNKRNKSKNNPTNKRHMNGGVRLRDEDNDDDDDDDDASSVSVDTTSSSIRTIESIATNSTVEKLKVGLNDDSADNKNSLTFRKVNKGFGLQKSKKNNQNGQDYSNNNIVNDNNIVKNNNKNINNIINNYKVNDNTDKNEKNRENNGNDLVNFDNFNVKNCESINNKESSSLYFNAHELSTLKQEEHKQQQQQQQLQQKQKLQQNGLQKTFKRETQQQNSHFLSPDYDSKSNNLKNLTQQQQQIQLQHQLQQHQNQQLQQQQQQQQQLQHSQLQRKHSNSSVVEHTVILERCSTLEFSLLGGNIDGVAIDDCAVGSKSQIAGLINGDEIKEIDGWCAAGRNKEEVYRMLTRNGPKHLELKINRNSRPNDVTTIKRSGDRFFVKACFDYDVNKDNKNSEFHGERSSGGDVLNVKKGDVFCVIDSLPLNNKMGNFWRVVRATGPQNEGLIPNRKYASAILNEALQAELEASSEKRRLRGSLTMRSFRKSKSVEAEKQENFQLSTSLTAYVNVMLVAPEIKRPVFVAGLFADAVCRRLIIDSPGLYEIPDDIVEMNRSLATSPSPSTASNSFVNLKPLIDISNRGKHAVCCLSPAALTYIRQSTTLDPIAIFLSPPNKNVVIEVNRRLSKPEIPLKKASSFFEESAKFEKTHSQLFDAILPFNSDDSWFAILKDTVDKIQVMPKWRAVELVDDFTTETDIPSDNSTPNVANETTKLMRSSATKNNKDPSKRHSKTTDDLPDCPNSGERYNSEPDPKKKISPLKPSKSSNNLATAAADEEAEGDKKTKRKFSDFSISRKGSRIRLNF